MKKVTLLARKRILVLVAANLAIALVVFFSTSTSRSPNLEPMPLSAVRGQKVWQAGNCISCHAIYGLGGHLGPDLTNVHRRIGKEAIGFTIRQGLGKMPGSTIETSRMDDLVAYLAYLDSSGEYPVKSFPKGSYGRFE